MENMCRGDETTSSQISIAKSQSYLDDNDVGTEPPIKVLLEPPTIAARCTCISILIAVLAIWCKFAFVDESQIPDEKNIQMHGGNCVLPLVLTALYLVSLPLLKLFTDHFLSKKVDVKTLLWESMIVYNIAQVVVNAWMVYKIIDGILFRGHAFVSGPIYVVNTGAPLAVYVHYCDKYLEFLDTYFMILRGKMDQVTFLHIYHHTSIALAWWIGLRLHPAGDIYFGALLNSFIHVMMYSYYTLALLKINCPWKKYLTMAQLTQFVTVLCYSAYSVTHMPQEANWRHYLGHGIQSFEMTSLFALFLLFFRKAYAKKSARKTTNSDAASLESKTEVLSLSSSESSGTSNSTEE